MNNATTEPWRVGVLFSQTGHMSVIEETQLRGTLLAIDEINCVGGVNGRELTPIIYDPASDNTLFRLYAKKLMTEDGVSSIFGCYTSSSRKVVLPIVERLNGLLWYPTLYEGFEYSPNVIYTGSAPNQNGLALCEYLVSNLGRRFYFIGSDYIYPRETNRIMRELLRGAEVIGESYVSLRAQRKDFLPIIRDIQRTRPDVIFSTVVGDSTVHLYQSYADAGFNPKTLPIASLTTTEAEIRAMGFDVGEGHITAASYFQNIDSASNASFVSRFKKRFGADEPTNIFSHSCATREAGRLSWRPLSFVPKSILYAAWYFRNSTSARRLRQLSRCSRSRRRRLSRRLSASQSSRAAAPVRPSVLACGHCVGFARGPEMEDLSAKLQKMLSEAEDCELIGKLATDVQKRQLFARLQLISVLRPAILKR